LNKQPEFQAGVGIQETRFKTGKMKETAKGVVRKLREEAKQPAWRRSKKIRWCIGISLVLIIAALFPRAHTPELSQYSVGSLWTGDDIVAPFNYPLQKDPSRYQQEVQLALEDLYPVFTIDSSALPKSKQNILDKLQLLKKASFSVAANDSLPSREYLDSLRAIGLTQEDIKPLLAFVAKQKTSPSEIETTLLRMIDGILDTSIVIRDISLDTVKGKKPYVSIVTRGNEETVIPEAHLVSAEQVQNFTVSQMESRFKNTKLAYGLAKIAGTSLVPMAIYSPERTEQSREALYSKVLRTDGIIEEGQHIINRGEVITSSSKAALESLSQARLERGGMGAQIARVIGTISHVAIIILLVVLYLKFIRRKIYNDNAQLLLLSLALLFPALMAFATVHIRANFPLEYLIMLPISAMLLTIIFDSRTGFYGTVISSLIVAGIRGNDYAIALACLSAGSFATYTVRDLRSRSQLFKSIGYIFLGYLIAIGSLALERSTPLLELGAQLLAAMGNALISPVLTLGLLFIVETIFDTVSDIRLTEFDNINHPLLRELSMRAPGTYQHTMMVAQLAENGAIAIGANALLAKVGAYYHDIGKLTEPQTFIENQSAETTNVHELVTPQESAERVRRHVTEGIELGHAHHLPERLIDFIPMHHGTLRISFFYDRALALGEITAGSDDSQYRYPGPKPNTKETVIVMLADASEAIARTIAAKSEEPSIEAIQEGIDKLVAARIAEGQLDNSDITMHELTIIKQVFARLLAGLHHARISYPTPLPIPSEKNKNTKMKRKEKVAA